MHGPTRIDLHVKVLTERVVERAKACGLHALVFAPHFERFPQIRERAARFSDDDLTVIPAREIFTGTWRNRKHLLAIGLSEPVPDFISLNGAFEELNRQNAAILVPHPMFLTVSLGPREIRAHRDAIDAIEIHNPKYFPWHDRRAEKLAAQSGIPEFASSYAHVPGTVGEVWTEFHGADPSETGLVEALTSGVPRATERRTGVRYTLRRAVELGHLGWENSWEKFDRVVLSEHEETHPSHPAYDGRFDDISVY